MIDLKSALESVKYNGQNPLLQLGMGGQAGLNPQTELDKLGAGAVSGGQAGLGNGIQSAVPGILKQILGTIAL